MSDSEDLKQLVDVIPIDSIIDDLIANNPEKVEQVRLKPALIGWFISQVMKTTGGKANPQTINDQLKSKLNL